MSIKKFNDFSVNENLILKDLEIGEYYTIHRPYYKDDCRCIFKYSGTGTSDDYIKVSMFCSTDQEEYCEDTQITISKEGTGKGSYIKPATKEEIDFLLKNKKMYDEGYFDNLY